MVFSINEIIGAAMVATSLVGLAIGWGRWAIIAERRRIADELAEIGIQINTIRRGRQ